MKKLLAGAVFSALVGGIASAADMPVAPAHLVAGDRISGPSSRRFDDALRLAPFREGLRMA